MRARPGRLFHQAGDQILFEWMLAHAAHAVVAGENPLYSTGLNAPDGVNLMANTSVLGLGVPLAPVTLLFGSQVAFCVAVVCCLAGTAVAWYVLLRRRLVRTRAAAAVGRADLWLRPGHDRSGGRTLHIAAQFLVPAILALVFRPTSGDARHDVWRPGVGLGLLLVWQVFIGEEVLVFLALAAGVFALAYALADRLAARRLAPALLGRLAVAAGVAAVPLAYPLWFQFHGPQHYSGMAFATQGFQLDAASFTASARQTVLGDDWLPGLLSPNPTEENSFFGPGLLVLAVVIVIWQWRRPLVRALAAAGVVFALLSLGGELRVDGEATGIPGPYRLVERAAAARSRGAGPVRVGLRTGAGCAGGAVPGPGPRRSERGAGPTGAVAVGRRGHRRVAAPDADAAARGAGRAGAGVHRRRRLASAGAARSDGGRRASGHRCRA